MPPRRAPLPSLSSIARQLTPKAKRAMQRVAKRHGPLGLSVPATDDVEGWTGPVVRLEDLTDAERIAIGGRARGDDAYRSRHETWRCVGCREWTMNDAAHWGRCNWCGVPRSDFTGPSATVGGSLRLY